MGDGGRQKGVVCRLAADGRLGYARTAEGTRAYMFVVGRVLSNREAATLRLGRPVTFRLAERDSVENLRLP